MKQETHFILRKFIIDLLCLGIVGVPLLMFKSFSEPFKRGFFCNDESLGHPYHESTVPFLAIELIGYGATSVIVIGLLYFGCICTKLTTNIGKNVIGSLRPHFMDICKPNIDCTLAENLHRYIEDFECLGTNTRRRGFFCNDESLGHPYHGSTVPFLAVELISYGATSVIVIGLLYFGCICTKLTTDIGKNVVGRLRPHFMDICKPNIDRLYFG
ncbi:hypothetical protein B566_EDAN005354 [Ephemera danica]|nr:hypothetical protein B566_EDAN005354 [Ephemera danica]